MIITSTPWRIPPHEPDSTTTSRSNDRMRFRGEGGGWSKDESTMGLRLPAMEHASSGSGLKDSNLLENERSAAITALAAKVMTR